MILKDISLERPEDNILLDEAMYLSAEKHSGPEVLRFWESPKVFIVLGRIGKEQEDLFTAEILKDEIPVLRRTSGGGTVVQGPGCLNYSVVIHKSRGNDIADLRLSYQWISQRVIDALGRQGVRGVFRPISDIALAGSDKKFSGNAQRRGRDHILHHGTILYDFDLDKVFRYLRMPRDIPEYRRGRDHRDFIANIAIDPGRFKADLAELFGVTGSDGSISLQERDLLASLKEKFPFRVDVHPHEQQ